MLNLTEASARPEHLDTLELTHTPDGTLDATQNAVTEQEDTLESVTPVTMPVLERRISYIANIRQRTGEPNSGPLRRALDAIRTGVFGQQVDRVRQASDVQEKKALKQELPAFAFAGHFTRVNSKPENLLSSSGFVTLDLDKLEDLEGVRALVMSSQHTLACFLSTSGDGLKVMVEVTPAPVSNEEYARAYHAVAHKLAVEADPAAKDISRLCFVTHDPDLYVNDAATPLDLSTVEAFSRTQVPTSDTVGAPKAAVRKASVQWPITKLPDGAKHPMLIHLGGVLRHEGFDESVIRSTLHHLHEKHSETPGDPNHVDTIASYVSQFEPGNNGVTRKAFLNNLVATGALLAADATRAGKSPVPQSVPAAPLSSSPDILVMKSASQWVTEAMATPMPKEVLGSLVFERELCVLFADTNAGKSVLGVQIADCVSRGVPLHPFPMQTEAQKVLYLDCELSAQQFAKRTLDADGKPYVFDERFIRAEIKRDPEITAGRFDEAILSAVEESITTLGVHFVVIDNLTYLKSSTEDAKDAIPLMKQLARLRSDYEVTLIVIAHTPKRNESNPIVLNDLAGSRHLMNYMDSAVAIGRSSEDTGLRYVKQVKARSSEYEYGERNVAVFRLAKSEGLLQFQFQEFADELSHLRTRKLAEDPLLEEMLRLKQEGNSLRQIASTLSTPESTVNPMRVQRALKGSTSKTEDAVKQEAEIAAAFSLPKGDR